MTQNEIREELHKTIDRMDVVKLRRLRHMVADLMKTPPTPEKNETLREGGFAKSKIHLAKDWNSKKVNEEIAREFGMTD